MTKTQLRLDIIREGIYLLKKGAPQAAFSLLDFLTDSRTRFSKYPVEWFGILAETAFRTHLYNMHRFNYFDDVTISTHEQIGEQTITLHMETGKIIMPEWIESAKAYMDDNFRAFKFNKLGRKVYAVNFNVSLQADNVIISVTFKQQ